MKKTIRFCILLFAFCVFLTACSCGSECEHTYDNACDAICNDCGESRETSAHQWKDATCTTLKTCTVCQATEGEMLPHNWEDATCVTAKTCKTCQATEGEKLPHNWEDATCVTAKTCKTCKVTEGEPLGHKPAEDDGDCGTDVLCTVCGAVTTPARLEHIAHADDGDCTTSVNCAECGWLMKPAQEHNFAGDLKTDADGHWQMCQNVDCKVAGTKESHNKGEDGKCTVCGYVVEVLPPHEHSYTVADYDDTHHYMRCACGAIDESTKVSHSATSDNNCVTPDLCTCGYTVTAAKDHVAGADDGNCETPIGCVNCGKDAKAGATGHHDADHDYLCDNEGCQVTVGNPPEDENSGIDLPIDRN